MQIKYRSPVAVIILCIVTFGIYAIYWTFKTKDEINTQGATIPTAWLVFVPIANLYFFYRYFLRLGFLDGKEGAIFHFMHAFWFRLLVDINLDDLLHTGIPGAPKNSK